MPDRPFESHATVKPMPGTCLRCVYGTGLHAEKCSLTDLYLVARRKLGESESEWGQRCVVVRNAPKASLPTAGHEIPPSLSERQEAALRRVRTDFDRALKFESDLFANAEHRVTTMRADFDRGFSR